MAVSSVFFCLFCHIFQGYLEYRKAVATLLEEYSAFGRCDTATLDLLLIDYGRSAAGAVAVVIGP